MSIWYVLDLIREESGGMDLPAISVPFFLKIYIFQVVRASMGILPREWTQGTRNVHDIAPETAEFSIPRPSFESGRTLVRSKRMKSEWLTRWKRSSWRAKRR